MDAPNCSKNNPAFGFHDIERDFPMEVTNILVKKWVPIVLGNATFVLVPSERIFQYVPNPNRHMNEVLPDQPPAGSKKGLWPTTHHTLLAVATSANQEEAGAAVRKLCVLYHEPIEKWLLSRGIVPDRVQDLRGEFVLFLLEKNPFQKYQRQKAKFRSYLIRCLHNFVLDRARGLPPEPDPNTEIDSLPGKPGDIDSSIDEQFALTIHTRVMERLRAERYADETKAHRLRELRRFLFGRDTDISYNVIAARLSLKPNAVKKAVFDLRDAYMEGFQREIEQIAEPAVVMEEMRYLLSLLALRVESDDEHIPNLKERNL